ncbi:uncharacterized protein N7469_004575 [Penicillium citrinum]|uniref:Uncharacterized protein n=1 Tax=Penicillium citrinum TaxID=5077 RepID=A0A9W9P7C9_PENCI|nr:uncharacterized protein N7469_004575 [Penicillium citrinum]KAJ5235407.1 hypothetical protein N7469_004575 [Penicillium citrinum]
MDATQGLGNSRLISSTIPAADLYSPVSAEVRSSSQSEQAANFQEPATPDTSEDTMGLTRSVYSASPITSSRRSDLTMNIPCHETCQMSSESQFETPPLPEATKASMTNDTTSGTHLRCFEISQGSQNTNLSSNQSDMMIFQPCVHPSQALQNTNETALYGREFNDTSLAMQGLYGGLSNIPIPEINDPMNAMHWFASQAEHYRRTVYSTPPNNAGAESGFRPLEPVLPNDTSLALFAIEPQTELNMTHPSFNDTSLTMSVFAPELLYYDERGFGTNCSQSVT